MHAKGDNFPAVQIPTVKEIDGSHLSGCSMTKVDVSNGQTFVPANEFSHHLVTHESLLENSELFYDKFFHFCESMGRKLVAIIGETALDLHALYKEVTSRGGLEQVTRDRAWVQVLSALNCMGKVDDPFLLEEHYAKLLYNFEQFYFHAKHNEPAAAIGDIIIGGIHRKFDGGYLITAAVGSKRLSGLLYHFEECMAEQFAIVPGLKDCVNPVSYSELVDHQIQVGYTKRKYGPTPRCKEIKETTVRQRSRNSFEIFLSEQYNLLKKTCTGNIRKIVIDAWKSLSERERLPYIEKSRKESKEHGLDTIRRPRNAYQIFFSEQYAQLKKTRGSVDGNVKKAVTEAWKHLSEIDRLPYIEESRKDKERFKREIATYKKQQNMQGSSSSSSSVEYRSYFPENYDNDYHVSLGKKCEGNQFVVPDVPMDQIYARLAEIGNQLDHMDWDFTGPLNISI